ncbi:MAG: outer membrane protein transport protein [Bdellovibrionales bacterium]|nr:outer membrane protein transport protein [Bdellovibrionales bacterium]
MNAKILKGLIALAAVSSSTSAFASGFEKSIVWGGRSAGLAGIATPWVQGAEALYFNPAGLVGDKEGRSLAFDISPTSSQFKGPINNNNDESVSERKLSTPLALMYGATVNDKLGYGIGAFVSGGAQAYFNDVDFSAATRFKPEVKTDLMISEISAGVGYKVSDDFKLGLAWRFVMAQADFSFVKRIGGTPGSPALDSFVNAKLTGLKDTEAMAFRLGGQYKLDEKTELGFGFRSEVNLEATGKVNAQLVSPNSTAGAANPSYADADATARTTFPMAVTLGMSHKLNDEWNLFGEYAWTQYSRIGEIPIEAPTSTFPGLRSTSLQTDWRDQHNIRLAGEYVATAWPVRFGYGYTSTVTNPDYARASFTPPGPAHTLTVGTGNAVKVGESDLNYNLGLEYTTTSGDVGGKASAGSSAYGSDTRNGSYSASAYVLHMGVAYLF